MKFVSTLFFLLTSLSLQAKPNPEMNKAFDALSDLVPFLSDEAKFVEKKNEKHIEQSITRMKEAFKSVKHEKVLKDDLFAPSYQVINESIDKGLKAFKAGQKDYAHWRLKEITNHCLDCHTRLPPSYTSSFQNGDLTIDKSKFENVYNLGLAQLIVRRYVDAKNSFVRAIQDRIVKKDYREIILPFKQMLVIDTKILKDPENLIPFVTENANKEQLPEDVKRTLKAWLPRLKHWQGQSVLKTGLKDDNAVKELIAKELAPLKLGVGTNEGLDVDFLMASGLLSNYLFKHPTSKMAPDISYWLGTTEVYLKREQFFGSGELFLKQCIRRYPKNPIAKKCLAEYKESVEFEFSGSSGTHLPDDVKKEILDFEKLIRIK